MRSRSRSKLRRVAQEHVVRVQLIRLRRTRRPSAAGKKKTNCASACTRPRSISSSVDPRPRAGDYLEITLRSGPACGPARRSPVIWMYPAISARVLRGRHVRWRSVRRRPGGDTASRSCRFARQVVPRFEVGIAFANMAGDSQARWRRGSSTRVLFEEEARRATASCALHRRLAVSRHGSPKAMPTSISGRTCSRTARPRGCIAAWSSTNGSPPDVSAAQNSREIAGYIQITATAAPGHTLARSKP